MKAKLLSLFGLSILVLVFLMSVVSALTLASSPTSVSLSTEGSSATIAITNTAGDGEFNIDSFDSTVTIEDSNSNQVVFTITNITDIVDVSTATFQITLFSADEDFALGTHSETLSIFGENVSNPLVNNTLEVTLNFDNSELCEYNNLGTNLEIDIDDINVDGFGDDENWFPLDEIEIEVEVKNDGPEDIDDIVLEWGLYNSETGEWVIDDEENDFNLKDGDEEIVTISFKLDDVDEFEDNGEYIFYVWATGEDDKFDGNKTCVSTTSEVIEIEIESDFVVLDDIQSPETVQCGEEVQILANVWNIGKDDQDEVTVYISSTGLGIAESIEVGDINKFDNSDSPLDFIFTVPTDAEEKTHIIRFIVYDEDSDVYENTNDDDAIFNIPLKVEGGCALEAPSASVTASLESEEAKAGEDIVVKITLTNLEDETVVYTINVKEYSSWASSAILDSQVVTLTAGASIEVFATFSVNEDVSGDQTFDIEVLSGNQVVVSQPAKVVDIEGKGRVGITGSSIRDNPYVWGIGIINIILIIVIVVVAIRLARK